MSDNIANQSKLNLSEETMDDRLDQIISSQFMKNSSLPIDVFNNKQQMKFIGKMAYNFWLNQRQIMFDHHPETKNKSFSWDTLKQYAKFGLVNRSDSDCIADLVQFHFIEKTMTNQKMCRFNPKWHREFVKLSEPDRMSWSVGCKVQIYDQTQNQWKDGCVYHVNGDQILVAYQLIKHRIANGRRLRIPSKQKLVHRFDDDDQVRSNPISRMSRDMLTVGTPLMIYSDSDCMWFGGVVDTVIHSQSPFDVLCIINYGEMEMKIERAHRWSPRIRTALEVDDAFTALKYYAPHHVMKGMEVNIWSENNQFAVAVVTEVIGACFLVVHTKDDKDDIILLRDDSGKLLLSTNTKLVVTNDCKLKVGKMNAMN